MAELGSVILPTAFYPFGVYLAYVFYTTSIPKDLLAAGRVDAGGHARQSNLGLGQAPM